MDESCPKRDDKQHCNCWYDGEPCCACGDNTVPAEPQVWCKNCGYHVVGGMCGYDTPCGQL